MEVELACIRQVGALAERGLKLTTPVSHRLTPPQEGDSPEQT
jgi:hypothetical protein